MSQPTLQHIPTPALTALESMVEHRRKRLEEEGHATLLEQRASIVPKLPDQVLSVADVMPEAMTVFERMHRRSEQFRAEILPRFAAAPPALACEIHPSTLRAISFELTCQETRRLQGETDERDQFVAAYERCPLCQAGEERQYQRRSWSRHGVPDRVLDATFANYQTPTPEQQKALAMVKDWVARRGNFLLLRGHTGTGKGHLSAAALKAHGRGLWVEHVNLLCDLRASYQTHTTRDLLATWQNAEVLVLDEFGLSPGGRDEEPLLYQILAHRHDKRRPTILTCNLSREALREAMGFRMLDRIREDLTEVQMTWGSWRSGKGEGAP